MTRAPGRTDGRDRLRDAYAQVLARIERAAAAAGRPSADIRLLAVSKTFPAEDVAALAALGQREFGENYLQEAQPKIAQLGTAPAAARPFVWHFIGPIQSNKTRPIAEHFDWVQSVGREKIAQRLSAQRPAGAAPLQVCIQVNPESASDHNGCAPEQVPALARAIAALPALRLRGLMTIPQPSTDPLEQRRAFAVVRAAYETLQREFTGSTAGPVDSDDTTPRIDTLSMGMSGDLEAAIAEGATMVRLGTALFGARPMPVTAESVA